MRPLACQSVTTEFTSGEPLAWTCPSMRTVTAAEPVHAGQEAERQKRDDACKLGNSGFHGAATLAYYLVE
jgi:hypothetical protein